LRGLAQPGSRQLRSQVNFARTIYKWLVCDEFRDAESGLDSIDSVYNLARFGQSFQGRQRRRENNQSVQVVRIAFEHGLRGVDRILELSGTVIGAGKNGGKHKGVKRCYANRMTGGLNRFMGAAEVAQYVGLGRECRVTTRSFAGCEIRFLNRLHVFAADEMQMREHDMRQAGGVVPFKCLARPYFRALKCLFRL